MAESYAFSTSAILGTFGIGTGAGLATSFATARVDACWRAAGIAEARRRVGGLVAGFAAGRLAGADFLAALPRDAVFAARAGAAIRVVFAAGFAAGRAFAFAESFAGRAAGFALALTLAAGRRAGALTAFFATGREALADAAFADFFAAGFFATGFFAALTGFAGVLAFAAARAGAFAATFFAFGAGLAFGAGFAFGASLAAFVAFLGFAGAVFFVAVGLDFPLADFALAVFELEFLIESLDGRIWSELCFAYRQVRDLSPMESFVYNRTGQLCQHGFQEALRVIGRAFAEATASKRCPKKTYATNWAGWPETMRSNPFAGSAAPRV